MWTIKVKGMYGEIIKEDGEGETYTEQFPAETATNEAYGRKYDNTATEGEN